MIGMHQVAQGTFGDDVIPRQSTGDSYGSRPIAVSKVGKRILLAYGWFLIRIQVKFFKVGKRILLAYGWFLIRIQVKFFKVG